MTPSTSADSSIGKSASSRFAGAGLVAWACALLILGTLSISAAWGHWLPVLLIALSAVAPLLTLRQALALRVPRWLATMSLLALLLLIGYVLNASAGVSLGQTLSDALPRLLSEPQPLAVRSDVLVAPCLVAGLAGLLTGLRLDSATKMTPVAAAFSLYVAGLLLTTGSADPFGVLALALLLTTAAGWVLLDPSAEPSRKRLGRLGIPLAVGASVLAGCGLVPLGAAYEPRDLVDPPLLTVRLSSPLPRLGAWAANPDLELLRATGDAVPLRLAVLDYYDGATWQAATEYAPIGTQGADALAPGTAPREVTVSVQLGELGGNWLPTPGQPEQVSDPSALVDPATGTVYAPEVEAGRSYDVVAWIDAPDPEALLEATIPAVGSGVGDLDRYLQLPEIGFALADYGNKITARATTPYARALAIEEAIRRDRKLSSKSISGSALWRIQSFLLEEPGRPGARVGTSEQFASAFAILARQSGLPTRIVVGFGPGQEAPDGTRVIRGRDALAWPEVYFADLGWVPFSPTPHDDTFAIDRPDPGKAPLGPEDPTSEPTPPESATPPQTPKPEQAWPWRLIGGAAGAVLVGGLLLVLGGMRWRRRSRHRRLGAPGSWAEILDALTLAGRRWPSAESATEIGARVRGEFGTDAAAEVARVAERVAFGPLRRDHPESSALRAQVRDVRRRLRRSLPWWRRWWWSFDPRVFRAAPAGELEGDAAHVGGADLTGDQVHGHGEAVAVAWSRHE